MRYGMYGICVALLLVVCVSTGEAQWTEPVPMTPQFGTGIRAPWISNDGLRLYLCTMADVNVTTRDSIGGPWGPLERLPDHINASPTQNSACESPTGDTLYFTSDSDYRPEGGYGWLDVYYSVRTDTGWGPVVNCGPGINGPGREWSVGISRDGSTLLTSSGGPHGWYPDLYYCTRQSDGTWGTPVNFGPNINAMGDEDSPCLSPDNNRLFFSSDGANSGDIYESHKVNGVWQPRSALPAPINSTFGTEANPCLSADGRTLWFRKAPWLGDFMMYTSEDTTVLSATAREFGRAASERSAVSVYPNPFNPVTQIRYEIPTAGIVTLKVFDVLGREVTTLVDQSVNAGSYSIEWNAESYPSGMYFAVLHAGNGRMVQKMLLLR